MMDGISLLAIKCLSVSLSHPVETDISDSEKVDPTVAPDGRDSSSVSLGETGTGRKDGRTEMNWSERG